MAQLRSGGNPAEPAEVRQQQVPKELAMSILRGDDTSDSEEEAPPESVIWEAESDGEAPDILDPKYDWRRNSRRGKKSRKNYSAFLAERIRENEDSIRSEREAQGGGEGPDFS